MGYDTEPRRSLLRHDDHPQIQARPHRHLPRQRRLHLNGHRGEDAHLAGPSSEPGRPRFHGTVELPAGAGQRRFREAGRRRQPRPGSAEDSDSRPRRPGFHVQRACSLGQCAFRRSSLPVRNLGDARLGWLGPVGERDDDPLRQGAPEGVRTPEVDRRNPLFHSGAGPQSVGSRDGNGRGLGDNRRLRALQSLLREDNR